MDDNAGSPPSIKALQDILWNTGDPSGFAETYETNVTATYYTTIAFLDLLHHGNLRRGALPPLFVARHPPAQQREASAGAVSAGDSDGQRYVLPAFVVARSTVFSKCHGSTSPVNVKCGTWFTSGYIAGHYCIICGGISSRCASAINLLHTGKTGMHSFWEINGEYPGSLEYQE